MGYTGTAFSKAEQYQICVEAITVLLGNGNVNSKHAALLLLKAFLPHRIIKEILEEDGIYPFDRDDYRVRRWAKDVLSRGICEKCGATEHLEAHHILKWADYPKGRADISNGMCLCHNCHTEEHKHDRSYAMMLAKKY